MKKYTILVTGMILSLILLAGCNAENETTAENQSEEKLNLYTTIYPLEDFTKKIGGDLVNVQNIFPPGADAHTYEPTTKIMVDIANSDGLIYSGVGLESFATKIQTSLEKEDVAFINAGEGLELVDMHSEDNHAAEEDTHSEDEHAAEEDTHSEDEHAAEEEDHSDHEHAAEEEDHSDHEHATEEDTHSEDEHAAEEGTHSEDEHAAEEDTHSEDEHGHNHGDTDPHVWIDPIRSITLAENIKNALVELHPEGADTFEKNFSDLKSKLEELDTQFSTVIESSDKKEILVSHAAYGYWEDKYGLEQISVLGLSPTQEPSQKELQTIIETAKEHSIKYIVFEENVSSNITDIVQGEIGAEAVTLSNLETITEEQIKNNEDYFSLMNKNLETLKKILSN
ncbi:metal ABC transporter solute-binding protein, Zn/Mn family [Bacillus weihaiensis]|uniref:metal ABC transporter solute-binding protein, Zn/Mn family n=1 Tax=Bacillus weihaiensis TaxID=1547283 RepID=UPI0023551740|nr:zinc ABC transporter substrate-binding protein [Bacillus weihaiensis]